MTFLSGVALVSCLFLKLTSSMGVIESPKVVIFLVLVVAIMRVLRLSLVIGISVDYFDQINWSLITFLFSRGEISRTLRMFVQNLLSWLSRLYLFLRLFVEGELRTSLGFTVEGAFFILADLRPIKE